MAAGVARPKAHGQAITSTATACSKASSTGAPVHNQPASVTSEGAYGALAWTDAQVQGEGASLDLDGLRPAQTPEFAATVTLGWEPAPGWRVAGTLRHVSAQFEDDRETDRLAPATTIDAFVAAPLGKGVSLIVRGENLTDEEIVTRNQGGSIDLGVPRTLWLGLRYGF